MDAPLRKAECALRDHPSSGRWLKQHPTTGRLSIDAAKVKAEANYDGKYLIATSDPDLSPGDSAVGYKNLLQAEAAFRTMKTTLDLRPVYHRLDERIIAHVLLCWLALLLIRVAERAAPGRAGPSSTASWDACIRSPCPVPPDGSGRPPASHPPRLSCSRTPTSQSGKRSAEA